MRQTKTTEREIRRSLKWSRFTSGCCGGQRKFNLGRKCLCLTNFNGAFSLSPDFDSSSVKASMPGNKAYTFAPEKTSRPMKTLLTFLILALAIAANAQGPLTSAVRGVITDKESGMTLPGVSVILVGSDPIRGVATDVDGRFLLKDVPVGRQSLLITFIGYKPQTIPNVMVASARESEVNVQLEESVEMLTEAVIESKDDERQPRNEMGLASSRGITIEEIMRFSGGLQDPARMAQSFAGVSNTSDDRNDIIIRGNSPAGVLWRMEGIDIPSPNHFGTLGTTGGPVSILNINNLGNSDFYTGAFPAEYGNALSGVFDLNLKNGNSNKREFLGQIGFNGFELGAEGPLLGKNKGSYIVNYRYSTLGVLGALGVNFGTGSAIPEYQDLTMKIDLPTKKAGRFSLFTIGGVSHIEFKTEEEDNDENLYSDNTQNSRFGSDLGIAGISHKHFFSDRLNGKLTLAASGAVVKGDIDTLSTTGEATRIFGSNNFQGKYSANYLLNFKVNSANTIRVGAMADMYDFALRDSVLHEGSFFRTADSEETALLVREFAAWKHKFSDRMAITMGAYAQHFLLNNTYAVDPRFAARYQAAPRHAFTAAAGIHSQLQPITLYFKNDPDQPDATNNRNLGMNRSAQALAGHEWMMFENFRLKTEAYYQHLFDIAVSTEPNSFSVLNVGADFTIPDITGLTNTGRGRNYGLELTVERFFVRGFYTMTTASLFKSEFLASDDKWRNISFNGQFVFNFLAGKEFVIRERNSFSIDTKFTLAGGRWYTPIDLEASRAQGREVRPEQLAFSEQYDPYLRWDIKFTYRMNREKISQQFAIDFRNATNRQNIFMQTFNRNSGQLDTIYQIGFFPDVQYRIYF